MIPEDLDKRHFLVCHSKNCSKAKHNKRCTMSGVPDYGSLGDHARQFNAIKFCMFYTNSTVLTHIATPNWRVSPHKPGHRKIMQMHKAEQAEAEANPDFLEILDDAYEHSS